GRWGRPAMQALQAGKRLRGTRFDPFGRTEMRRLERSLPGEFTTAMTTIYRSLTVDRLDTAIAIAGLPDDVRGYEALKLRRAAEFRTKLAEAIDRFHAAPSQTG
ncbi:MAG: DUF6537 domain-containing protein, partial [Actinomycetota bacterium]